VRPPSSTPPAPTYTHGARADAKVKACETYDIVRKGVSLTTNLQNFGGDAEVIGALAVAANARPSRYDGGQYLSARLGPATPKSANYLMDIGAAATAGTQNRPRSRGRGRAMRMR
jgi:hypothetical protein